MTICGVVAHAVSSGFRGGVLHGFRRTDWVRRRAKTSSIQRHLPRPSPPPDDDMDENMDGREPLTPAGKATKGKMPLLVLVLTAVSASFAGNAVILKVALKEHVDPVVFSFLRDVGGAAVLLGVCKFRGELVWPRREDLGTFVLLGVLGVYIGQQFMVIALQFISPLNAMLLQPSQPVLTVLLSALFGIEALELATVHGKLKFFGIIIGAAGEECLLARPQTTHPSSRGALTPHSDDGAQALSILCT